MRLEFVILLVPAPLGIIVRKETAVPAAIQLARPAVKTLGRFVKENVSRGENDFVRVAVEVFNKDGPLQ